MVVVGVVVVRVVVVRVVGVRAWGSGVRQGLAGVRQYPSVARTSVGVGPWWLPISMARGT